MKNLELNTLTLIGLLNTRHTWAIDIDAADFRASHVTGVDRHYIFANALSSV